MTRWFTSTKKALAEHGDKLDAGEKEKIEAAIKELEDVLKSGDKAEIDTKLGNLSTASQKLGEKVYADMQAQQAAAGAAQVQRQAQMQNHKMMTWSMLNLKK